MQIIVRHQATNNRAVLNVSETDTVAEVKAQLEIKFGCAVERLYLTRRQATAYLTADERSLDLDDNSNDDKALSGLCVSVLRCQLTQCSDIAVLQPQLSETQSLESPEGSLAATLPL